MEHIYFSSCSKCTLVYSSKRWSSTRQFLARCWSFSSAVSFRSWSRSSKSIYLRHTNFIYRLLIHRSCIPFALPYLSCALYESWYKFEGFIVFIRTLKSYNKPYLNLKNPYYCFLCQGRVDFFWCSWYSIRKWRYTVGLPVMLIHRWKIAVSKMCFKQH